MSRRSRPTHDHIHEDEHEFTAVDYLEDNEYRRNTLPRLADWYEVQETPILIPQTARQAASSLAQIVYSGTVNDGGITVSLDGQQPSQGFAHSLDVANEVKIPLDKFSPEDVEHYIQSRHQQLSEPDKYIGTWVSNGVVYLDISQVKLDHDEAYTGARDAQQEAMWDIAGNREIPITENAAVDRPVSQDWQEDLAPAST